MPQTLVLVVDDDAAIATFVTAALEDAGYAVAWAVDGAALPLACERHPAVILLDLVMPGMDGGEVSRRLRANTRTAAIPIIVMSAQPDLRGAVAALPVDDQLPKPFTLDELYARVAQWAALASDPRVRWRSVGTASYAFDRSLKRVVAWTLPAAVGGGWRVYLRGAATSEGPFATPAAAQQAAEQRLLA
jgi:DNA-binding response OmpR family regulator